MRLGFAKLASLLAGLCVLAFAACMDISFVDVDIPSKCQVKCEKVGCCCCNQYDDLHYVKNTFECTQPAEGETMECFGPCTTPNPTTVTPCPSDAGDDGSGGAAGSGGAGGTGGAGGSGGGEVDGGTDAGVDGSSSFCAGQCVPGTPAGWNSHPYFVWFGKETDPQPDPPLSLDVGWQG